MPDNPQYIDVLTVNRPMAWFSVFLQIVGVLLMVLPVLGLFITTLRAGPDGDWNAVFEMAKAAGLVIAGGGVLYYVNAPDGRNNEAL